MNFRKYLFIFILVFIGILPFYLPAFAAEVSLTPSSTEVAVGSQFTVTVQVSDVSDLSNVVFDLTFDPTVLQFVPPAVEGDFLNQNLDEGESTDLLAVEVEDMPGDVTVFYSRMAASGVTGSGDLMDLTFTALAEGTSDLTFFNLTDFSLTDSLFEPIPATWQNADVTVIPNPPSEDTAPPSMPADLQATAISSGQIDLTWTPSMDNVGVAGYKIYRDGVELATASVTFYSDTGLAASTAYSYSVSAYDEAGNESEQSESAGVITLDEALPAIVSISPSSTEVTVGSQVTVTVQISNVVDLFGVAFDLFFDPDILEFVSVSEGGFLNSDGDIPPPDTAVNPAGDLIVGYARLPSVGVSGSGDLLSFTFNSLAGGTSTLDFQTKPESLVTPNLSPIPATWDDGLVTVNPAPSDATPPVRSEGLPTGTLTTGTTQTNLSLVTDENAVCRYSSIAGTLYASMTDTFSETGGTSHATIVTGLQDGQTYTYYVRCIDSTGNADTDDFVISFDIAAPPVPPPGPAGGGGGGGIFLTPLIIASESVEQTITEDNRIIISWHTSHYSTGQVIYSSENEPHALDISDTASSPPKYGYARATNEIDINPKTTFHSVSLIDVQPGMMYYFRTISRGSFAVSPEYTFTVREIKKATEENGGATLVKDKPAEEAISPSEQEKPAVFKKQIPEEKPEGGAEELQQEVRNTDLVQEKSSEKTQSSRGLLTAIGASIDNTYSIVVGAIIIVVLATGWRMFLMLRKKKQ